MNPSPRACSSTTYYTRVLLVLLLAFTMAMAGALPGGSPADAQEDVPTFSVGLDTGGLVGSGWVPGTDVTVTVGDPGDPTETAVGSVDDGGWWRINVDADLAPGTLVTVTDGDTTKEHLVAHLELDVDPATAVVSGEAEPGTTVTVSLLQWPDGPGGPEVIHEEDVVADAEGSWTVDLGAEGFEFDERHMVFVAVVDAEGDSTLLVWSLPSGVCPAPSATPAFPDVSADNVHVDGIDCAAYHEIALGYTDGTYRPANGVRRDQMASFIARTLDTAGHTLPSLDHTFTDIAGNTHEQAIGQLAAADIVLGRTPTDYAPDRTVTRDQMASYLVRALEWAHDTTYTAPKSPFTDIAGNTHEQAIDIAYDLGLTTGRTETTYEPRIDVRRDQMASFLVRLLSELASAEGAVIIEKEVVGEFDGDPFEFTITCGEFSDTFVLRDGETYEKRGLPGGVIVETNGDFELDGGTTCDIAETNPQGAVTTITLTPADIVFEQTTTIEDVWILAGETRQVTFTNAYNGPNG